MTSLNVAGSRVLLIGTARYNKDSGLPSIPAVPATISDLGQVLVERCGLDEKNLRIVRDPASPTEMGDAVAEVAESARDVLWVYYVGHGLVGRTGELYLATVGTNPSTNRLAHTALAYTAVRESLLETKARSILVVLDCCFSGRAVGVLGPDNEVDRARVDGGYVLAAAARDALALAKQGEMHTGFTGELIRLLSEGDPEGPQQLTLGHVSKYLSWKLPARGYPQPQHHASDWIEELVLCPNPAYQPSAMRSESTRSSSGVESQVCPYPGLAAFGPGQTQWFFGREELTAELTALLARRMDATEPLVVVGPSGSGKSSLLGAGLLPALANGDMPVPGSRTWPHLLFTPTEHPFTELVNRLTQLTGNPTTYTSKHFADDPRQLSAAVRAVLQERAGQAPITGARLIIVVDQFEEIFTQCSNEDERRAFVRALCTLTDGHGSEPAALVVLGLRADFYSRCAEYPELRPALQNAPFVVGAMSISELRDAIIRPAEVTDQALQPGLVEILLRDLDVSEETERSYSPGALPLLAHALQATWQHREDYTLTVSGYLATGGIKGAVAATAEAAYDKFDATGQDAIRLLMLRMVQIGENSEDSRRRVPRVRLMQDLPFPEAATAALNALVDARLVTLDAGTAEITHEALLSAWPRLREWIDADRAGLRIHQQLTEAADAWEQAKKDSGHLYQGTRLDLVQEWVADLTHQGDLTTLERGFLDASSLAAQRRARRRRQVVVTLTILLVVAISAGVVAFQQRHTAQDQRRIAIARQLTAQSATQAAGGHPEASILDAIVAFRQAPSLVETRNALLSSQSQFFAARLTGHKDVVYWAAFSPDGRMLATASVDRTVKLWDVARHTEIATLVGHKDDVNGVAFSPDGRTLASASRDRTVKLWDVASRKVIATLEADDIINGVAFSPDGRILATADNDRTARLWNVVSRKQIATFAGHKELVGAVAFSPDGRTLATASVDSTVKLWDVARHTEIATLVGHKDDVNGVVFSPDGRMLVTASNDRTARLWDVESRKQIATLSVPTGAVWVAAFSPDGRTLATTDIDGTAQLWDVASHEEIATLAGHTGAVWGAVFSPDGRTLATTSNDDSAVLWNMNGSILMSHPEAPAKKTAFSPDGRLLVTTHNDGTAKLWDVASRKAIATLAGHTDAVWGAGFSPDGRTLATTSNDGTAKLWDVASRKVIATLEHPGAHLVLGVAFSPDGRTLVTTTNTGEAKLWDVASRKEITTLTHPDTIWGAAFSPNGKILATASSDKTVKLWDVTRHSAIGTLTGHTGYVYGVTFSPDGKTLASTSDDKTVRLWDVGKRRSSAILTGHADAVWGAAFSPDGSTLATASTDKTVKLWDVARHNLIATLTGHTGPVFGVVFSPDGKTLATTSNDGSLRLWDTDPARVISYDCRLIGPISRSQWAQLLPETSYHPTCH